MKKTIVIGGGIIIAAVLVLGALTLAAGRWATVDRFNPFLGESTDYVSAPPGARDITDARAVNAAGEELDYRLTFTAYGAGEGGILAVRHQGAHVSSLDYPDPEGVPEPARNALAWAREEPDEAR